MIDAIKNNKVAIMLAAISVGVLFTILSMQGCNIEDNIKVDVPPRVAETTGVPETVSLNEAQYVMTEWMSQVRADAERFTDSIDQGKAVAKFLRSMVTLGLESVEAPIGALPGGAVLLSLLTGATGLFLRQPGTQKLLDASYDSGVNDTLKTLKEGKA